MSQVYMLSGHLPVEGTKTCSSGGGDDGDDGKERGGDADDLAGEEVGDERAGDTSISS
jgi:hypothetical protein